MNRARRRDRARRARRVAPRRQAEPRRGVAPTAQVGTPGDGQPWDGAPLGGTGPFGLPPSFADAALAADRRGVQQQRRFWVRLWPLWAGAAGASLVGQLTWTRLLLAVVAETLLMAMAGELADRGMLPRLLRARWEALPPLVGGTVLFALAHTLAWERIPIALLAAVAHARMSRRGPARLRAAGLHALGSALWMGSVALRS